MQTNNRRLSHINHNKNVYCYSVRLRIHHIELPNSVHLRSFTHMKNTHIFPLIIATAQNMSDNLKYYPTQQRKLFHIPCECRMPYVNYPINKLLIFHLKSHYIKNIELSRTNSY